MSDTPVYPFSRIVSCSEIKTALLLNVVDPKIGGVILIGDRGSAKSTCVRGLADILPHIEVVAGDPFQSHPSNRSLISPSVREQKLNQETLRTEIIRIPLVDLPLGSTEDRICGTIDVEQALRKGVKAFEPGLLAQANRGILYVDEVNLLDDHLVDVLLDAAASGWSKVEREGISFGHPSRFILVGSGNPEEGELRPQLLDRFGLYVTQKNMSISLEERILVVLRRSNYESEPYAFRSIWAAEQSQLSSIVRDSSLVLELITVPFESARTVALRCATIGVDGIRGDIVTRRARRAFRAMKFLRDLNTQSKRDFPTQNQEIETPSYAENTQSSAETLSHFIKTIAPKVQNSDLYNVAPLSLSHRTHEPYPADFFR